MNLEGSQFNLHHTNENKQKLFTHTPVILRESGTITFIGQETQRQAESGVG